jgi:hypothetical protein
METNVTTDRVMEIHDQKIELQGATLLHLNEIRKWTNFLSILGFVAFGLLVFVGIIMIFASSIASSMAFNPFAAMGPWIGIIYIIISGIYFIPVYYLFRFSTLAKQSLLQINLGGGSSDALMAQAIDYLKRHFRFVGIFTIVILSMYILILIGVVMMVAMR